MAGAILSDAHADNYMARGITGTSCKAWEINSLLYDMCVIVSIW